MKLKLYFVSIYVAMSPGLIDHAIAQNQIEPVLLVDELGRQVPLKEGDSRVVGQYGLGEPKLVYVAGGFRVTFCENGGVKARCARLVGGADAEPIGRAAPFSAVGTVISVEKALFGFADLHVHPATHLAFGARGGQGVLWGKPGMAHDHPASAVGDLPPCPDHHSSGSMTPFEKEVRKIMVKLRQPQHGPVQFGAPNFDYWPHALDEVHQQMHVTMLRRAYEGGLRLMVASVTDSQVLDIIWHPQFSLSQGRFALREDYDFKSAVDQFNFIQRFVSANSSWMTLARTPAEARRALRQDKLVVVLGLEMDELSTAEILDLKRKYGVALVTPIHLVDNTFGGAAVYDDMFNAANYAINGDLFAIENDPDLTFRLAAAADPLMRIPVVKDLLGPIGHRLSEYAATPRGHRNKVGLRDDYGLRRLMKAGMLVDVAHMSSHSTDATLALAAKFSAPVVHSHGGLRVGTPKTERGMTERQFQALVQSGGMLGVGTGNNGAAAPLTYWIRRYMEVAEMGSGAVAIGSDLNGMAKQIERVEMGVDYPIDTMANLDWRGRSRPLEKFRLLNKTYDIREHGIAHIGMLPDFLAAARARAPDDRKHEFDQVFHSAHDFVAMWEKANRVAPSVDAALPALALRQLRLDIETGTDNLKCGNVMVEAFKRSGGRDVQAAPPAFIMQGLSPHSKHSLSLNVLPGTQVRDVTKLRLRYLNRQCDVFDTGDSWNIKTIKVSYSVTANDEPHRGLMIHKRGAPAKRLSRGSSWNVYTER